MDPSSNSASDPRAEGKVPTAVSPSRSLPRASTPTAPLQRAPAGLAVFEEDPAFEDPLHVGRPNLGDRRAFRSRVESIFDRKWLSNNGPLVQEFEARLEDITGARHCVAVTNGTVGLELVIRALGLTGEVIVPSYTFIATVHALRWHGLTPVFCDVDPVSHNLDPDRVEALITPKTSAIAAVHLWGRACDTERLQQIADRHGLRLMYDAAHAFGCSRGGQMVGTFGDAEVYSFHATKFVNAFEGGAVATNSDALAETLRSMKNFGFAGYDNVQSLGVNGKMSEVSAAMGLTSLESMDAIIATNRRNYDAYRREIDRVNGLSLIDFDEADRSNYQYVIVEVDSDEAGLTRDEIVSVLEAEQVLARRYFYPGCHRMEPYATEQPCVGERLPVTEHLSDAVLALPTGTAVDISHIRAIGGILRAAVSDASRVRSHLRRHGITPH